MFLAQCTPDSGSTQSVISSRLVRRAGIPLSSGKHTPLVNASGMPMVVEGRVLLDAKLPDTTDLVRIDAIVSSDLTAQMLVSWHD